ncbi:protein kinase domain-containing protein [Streptomyces glaucescens]|uniref:serine/threonine-protein kinase n=1 Tax=Streptomyces glaucescens TaxID=1907 RepID=UPI000A3D53B9|nr:serine/threonine-protein kinase [Streptomyces glaucescens]
MPLPLTHDDPVALGPYRLIARLGSGGMGTVYAARSAGGRTVALKTMHAAIAADQAARTRFRLEVDAARVIGGEFGARVMDADPLAPTPWLATEYVLGPPLDEAVEASGPLPEEAVRALGASLCAALGRLHGSEVVHRDLKPSNILVTAYGPKLIDFGIARAIGDDRLTRVGAAVGTPAFMSPEQATGQDHDAAGDVFALAGVLVFAATGRAPFGHGQTQDLLYRVRYGDPDLSGVPTGLVPILVQCLDKNPFRRPTTAALAARLHDGTGHFADHLPDALLAEIARRATEVWHITPQRLPAPSPLNASDAPPPAVMSRRRLLLAGSGLTVAAVAAGAGAWVWSRRPTSAPTPPLVGPSNSVLPTKDLDSIWQRQISDSAYDHPAEPLVVRGLVSVSTGSGLAGIDATTGDVRWTTGKYEPPWIVATDGERIVRLAEGADEEEDKAGGPPLTLVTLDPATGNAAEPFAGFTDLNGAMLYDQLLCTADGVAYVAAGRGKSDVYFRASQSWFLLAVDIGSGKRLWTVPLPSREDGSERLYFLTARVVGRHLVALRETNEGKIRIVVHDTGTGAVRWEKPLDGLSPDRLRQPLAADTRNLYLGTGRLQALRLSDGSRVWDSSTGRPDRTYGLPAVKDGVVYAVEKGLGLVAVDADSGRVTWEEKGGGGAKADLTAAPVIGTDHAYSRRSSDLWAIDLSSRTPTRSYRTTGDRFVAHEKAEVTLALGGKFLAAFPLE